jgi:NAD(P)H-nitrite reductase large subunit
MGVEQLRKSGFRGKIVMISKEKQLPYDRIILTKSLRAEASKLNLRNEEFY